MTESSKSQTRAPSRQGAKGGGLLCLVSLKKRKCSVENSSSRLIFRKPNGPKTGTFPAKKQAKVEFFKKKKQALSRFSYSLVKCRQNHNKRASTQKNTHLIGQFSQNGCLHGHARVKTGDFSTMEMSGSLACPTRLHSPFPPMPFRQKSLLLLAHYLKGAHV